MGLDDSEKKAVSDLKRKRGVVKAALTRIRTFVRNFNPREQSISLLEFRQEELPQLNRKFDDIQCQIELIDVDNFDEGETERENFETEYYSIRSEMQEIINLEKGLNSSIHNASSSAAGSAPRAQLAPIALPKFNGNILEWESFFDCFKVLVHQEEMYSPAQKFSYLRSTLSGPALDIVKGIPMTDTNYCIAIKKLQQRYDNKSLVIQSHIRSILDIPSITTAPSKGLQELHSRISTHIAALEALGQPVVHWDAWLVTIVLRKLDQSTIQAWQSRCGNTELPKYTDLEGFLAGRCIALESSETLQTAYNENIGSPSSSVTIHKNPKYDRTYKKGLFVSTSNKKEIKCECCSGTHRLYSCDTFKNLPVRERITMVRNLKLCFNCFTPGHMVTTCRSNYNCRKCQRKHNTLIHFEDSSDSKEIDDKINENSVASTSNNPIVDTAKTSLMAQHAASHVFLATASVFIMDYFGNRHECTVVLDSGSQVNFISKKLANLLKLPMKDAYLHISGIGAQQTRAASYVDVNIKSKTSGYQLDLLCYVLPNMVTDLAPCAEPREGWKIPEELLTNLADPNFYCTRRVDLLIGGGAFFELLETGRIPLGIGNISLQESKLGWVVTGEMGVSCLMSIGETLEENWKIGQDNEELESFGKSSKANQKCIEEAQALKHFRDTVRRDEAGRFVLQLPFKPEIDQIGETFTMATSRFLSVERRLQRDDALKTSYINFMDEYLQMGHMEEITNLQTPAQREFYLPHHPVLKASSLTTKLRVVFDASAKSTTGLSLNDVLMSGPNVQEELFAILVRFRKHQFVLMADVEKMFRQVLIRKEDRDMQRIVWRSKPNEELRTYRLSTVTYGTTPASFMATNCLMTLSEEFKNQYPFASDVIRRDFYMDDLMTGSNTIEECCELQRQIRTILETARFPLRKWCSNSATVLENIGTMHNDPLFTLEIGVDEIVRSLGLSWKPFPDHFTFQVEANLGRARLTKRMLLSDLNRVFDPMGFLVPVLIRGKIFMQQIWQMKLEWDGPLTDDLKRRWEDFYQQLRELSKLSIPRKAIPNTSELIEIHGFCDASLEAYGAAIYIRSRDINGQWHSRLLCAKSRVAPLKTLTIPRLELSGALTLAQLSVKVANAWDLKVHNFYLWTDSLIVLGWLNSQQKRLKTFVANRASQILSITKIKQWRHVRTSENPADVITRGLTPQKLIDSSIWWNGPPWLIQDTHEWKTAEVTMNEQDLPEQRPLKLALAVTMVATSWLLEQYSEWNKLIRITAYVFRFVQNLKSSRTDILSRTKGNLTTEELSRSKYHWIKVSQMQGFPNEINALKLNTTVHRSSCLKTLSPFLDEDGLIRVGGRLAYAPISNARKHPIVLPSDHKVTRLIFEGYHHEQLHCGPQALLAAVRRLYWPLRGRVIARSVTLRCVKCVKAKPRFMSPEMGQLPQYRVQCTRPFAVTGVDFAGPIIIRSGVRRVTGIKAWIALFVCFSTRAVHLEVVEDLSSKAFVAALRRFMSRRGRCTRIYSDNGTNFVGAQRELNIPLTDSIPIMRQDGIEWYFNPPSAPHFGGLWESAIKSAKHHLTRVMGENKLSLGELNTLLCQVEACLNSRPITPLSSDPSEPEALTPAHFLIGGTISLPEQDTLTNETLGLTRRWKYVQFLTQQFWKRWQTEYLPQCQIRGKWTSAKRPMKINDVVIIKDECTSPTKWKLGIVIRVHPGRDGIVRVVTLRTSSRAELKRPVVKLCLLPTEAETGVVETQ